MLPGTRAGGRVGALGVGEQPRTEPRPALQGSLEAVDLQEVEPHPCLSRPVDRGYSTVTVFARLRGWSTLSPLPLAM